VGVGGPFMGGFGGRGVTWVGGMCVGFVFSFTAAAATAAAASLEPLKCHNGDAKLLWGWHSGHPICNAPFFHPP